MAVGFSVGRVTRRARARTAGPAGGRRAWQTAATAAATAALVLCGLEGRAEAECDAGRSVALEIQAGPRDAAAKNDVLECLAAELRFSGLAICPGDATTSLARVLVRVEPALERAFVSVELPRSGPLQRDVDLAGFPAEARPMAIATVTDELLRSALAAPAPPLDAAPAAPAPAAAADERSSPPLGSASAGAPQERPRFEAGLGGAATAYARRREAIGADLSARFWVDPRLALTARVGTSARLARPSGHGRVQADAEQRAALGAGFELLPRARHFGLLATAGLQLSRVGFDEQLALTEGEDEPPPLLSPAGAIAIDPATGAPFGADGEPPTLTRRRYPLDHAWGLAGSLGLEASFHAAPIGVSAALSALVPVVPARSDWGSLDATAADPGALDTLGVELGVAVWLAIGADPAARTKDPVLEARGE